MPEQRKRGSKGKIKATQKRANEVKEKRKKNLNNSRRMLLCLEKVLVRGDTACYVGGRAPNAATTEDTQGAARRDGVKTQALQASRRGGVKAQAVRVTSGLKQIKAPRFLGSASVRTAALARRILGYNRRDRQTACDKTCSFWH